MSAELAVRIEAGELDAAVPTEPVKPYPYGLISKPLYQEGFWIIASEGTNPSSARRMLLEENSIRFDRRAWAGRVIDRELRRQRVRVQKGMELDSHAAIIRMVTSGLGAAIIPLSQHDLHSLGNVVRVPFGDPQMTCLFGILIQLSGLGLPPGIGPVLKALGQASLPLGLFCVGPALQLGSLHSWLQPAGLSSIAKFLLMPMTTLALCHAFGLRGDAAVAAILFQTLPTASSAYVMARRRRSVQSGHHRGANITGGHRSAGRVCRLACR